MRIAMITTSLPEPGRKPGGADVLLERVTRELCRHDHDVTVFSYSPSPDNAPYNHVALRPKWVAGGKLRRLTLASLPLNALDLTEFEVCHLHGDDWFFVRRRLPTVRTFYGSAWYEARHAESARRRFSQVAAFPLEILSSRLATRTYSLISHAADARWYRTSGGLECGQDSDPQAGEAAKHEIPAILFVGSWNGRKRGKLLADAFVHTVRPRIPNAELWMVSDHVEPADGITWFERPNDAELAELYRRAWVFCLPSSYEGFGIPYLEAMAHGTPVVATPNIGADHLLDGGRAGVLSSPQQIGDALCAVLLDRNLRDGLIAAGFTRSAHFTWERIVSLHERAYADAIEAFNGDAEAVGGCDLRRRGQRRTT